jgi:TM2 domain-containing membrane protein YozV
MSAPNTIRVVQTHDASGAESPAEFEQVITNVTASTLGWDAMTFLRPLNPVRTADPLVFTYSDPTRGSGWLRLEGFAPSDATRIHELVQVDEISRAVGADPIPKDDLTLGRGALLRTNNPWFMVVLGIVLALFGFVIFGFPQGNVDRVVSTVLGVLLLIAGLAVTVVGIIRTIWWHRARAYAKSTGQALPPDLKGGL